MFAQVLLVFRMQKPQATGRHFAEFVVIDAQVVHTPVSELIGVVKLARLQKPQTVFNGLVVVGLRESLQVLDDPTLDEVNQARQAQPVGQFEEIQAPGGRYCWHLVGVQVAQKLVEGVLSDSGEYDLERKTYQSLC